MVCTQWMFNQNSRKSRKMGETHWFPLRVLSVFTKLVHTFVCYLIDFQTFQMSHFLCPGKYLFSYSNRIWKYCSSNSNERECQNSKWQCFWFVCLFIYWINFKFVFLFPKFTCCSVVAWHRFFLVYHGEIPGFFTKVSNACWIVNKAWSSSCFSKTNRRRNAMKMDGINRINDSDPYKISVTNTSRVHWRKCSSFIAAVCQSVYLFAFG